MTLRLTAIAFLLAGLGPLGSIELDDHRHRAPVPMMAEDGRTYLVEPGETLGAAMIAKALQATAPAEEQGACVPEPMETKPEGAVSCRCYEITECKGNEARECKRHCKKELCQCCDV
jgi:hypothetical protein